MRRRSESGIFLPLAAIFLALIVAALFTLGIDSFFLKVAQRRLRAGVDYVCRRAAMSGVVQRRALQEFEHRISELNTSLDFLSRTKIVRARFSLPTMFNQFGESESEGLPFAAYTESQLSKQADNGIFNECRAAGIECAYVPDLNAGSLANPGELNSRFPASAVDNQRGAGHMAGCEVEAEVRSILGASSRSLRVKSLWWAPVRGYMRPRVWHPSSCDNAAEGLNPDQDGAAVSRRPGLTIGVAPELTTSAGDPKFRFVRESEPPQWLSDLDPIFQFSSAAGARGARKFDSTANIPYDSTQVLPAFSALAANITANNAVRVGCAPDGATCSYPGSSAYLPSVQEERLAACENPVILVRNLFVSTIAELASRHGQLRDTTEILAINPRSPLNGAINPPTRMVAFGEDLALPQYQAPFVMRQSSAGTWDDPLVPFERNANESEKFRALVANQLRDCYHLYDHKPGTNAVKTSISRADYIDLFPALENGNFEPVPPYSFRAALFSSSGGNYAWQQRDAWCATNSCRDRLTAAEALSILGSVQRCPIETADCKKDSAPLYPDLIGFFRYAGRLLPSTLGGDQYDGDGLTGAFPDERFGFPAIKSPGLFRAADVSADLPFEFDRYDVSANTASHILLVLHNFDSHEQVRLRELVDLLTRAQPADPGCNRPRPLTVAYFPASKADAAQASVLAQALGGNLENLSSPAPGTVKLFVFAPSDDPILEPDSFRSYWNGLLTDSDRNIVKLAESIFTNRILRMELKY